MSDSSAAGSARSVPLRSAFLGVVAGALSALFGVGGGFVIVPGLGAFGIGQRKANATSLAAVVPISAAASIAYFSRGHVHWLIAGILTFGGIFGAEIGSRLLARVPVRTLKLLFIAMLVAAAIRLLFEIESASQVQLSAVSAAELIILGVGIGVLSGLLGIGGGFLMVPAMMLIMSMEPALARGTSLMAIIPTAIYATVRNHRRRLVEFAHAARIGLSGAAASFVVGLFAVKLSDWLSNLLFAALLGAIAIRSIIELSDPVDATLSG